MSRKEAPRSYSAVVLGLLIATSRVVAGSGPEPSLVGTWEVHNEEGTMRFVFEANGSGSFEGMPFQWTFRDGSLALTMQGNEVSYRASVAQEELRLSGGDFETTVSLRRSGAVAAPEAPIEGKWQSPDGSIVELRADGTGTNRRGGFHWQASNGVLTFDDGSGGLVLAYHIEGDQLLLTANGDRATFVRAPSGASVASPPARQAGASGVVVNRVKLREEEVRKFEAQFHVRMLTGKYWYDATCGAWGMNGGPCVGFLPAKLQLGGPLPADASGGGTGVFINGRELHPLDVAALQRLTPVQPGRYWVDAIGNCGYEGYPVPILNLAQLAARASSGNSYTTRSNITGIGTGGDGHTSYVMGKDWSVIVGE